MKDGAIVFIDDNKVESYLCKEAMKDVKHDHSLIMFQDAASALDYITKNAKDIFMIISDINMPGMSGIELLEKINVDPQLKMMSIPFIFFTNSATPRDIEYAYSLSAQGYFQKPLDLNATAAMFNCIVSYWNLAHIPRDVFK